MLKTVELTLEMGELYGMCIYMSVKLKTKEALPLQSQKVQEASLTSGQSSEPPPPKGVLCGEVLKEGGSELSVTQVRTR